MLQPSAAGESGTAAGGCAAAGEALVGAPPLEPLARLPARAARPAARCGACAPTSMCSVGSGALKGQPCLDRGQRPTAGRAPACPATAEALRAELRALQESQAVLDLARTAARWDPRPCTTPTLTTCHKQETHAALTLARTAARWDPRPLSNPPLATCPGQQEQAALRPGSPRSQMGSPGLHSSFCLLARTARVTVAQQPAGAHDNASAVLVGVVQVARRGAGARRRHAEGRAGWRMRCFHSRARVGGRGAVFAHADSASGSASPRTASPCAWGTPGKAQTRPARRCPAVREAVGVSIQTEGTQLRIPGSGNPMCSAPPARAPGDGWDPARTAFSAGAAGGCMPGEGAPAAWTLAQVLEQTLALTLEWTPEQ